MQHARLMPPDVVLRPEDPSDADLVETLYAVAFGPGRFSRTAYRLREGVPHDAATSFVAERRGLVIGAIRQTRVSVASRRALNSPFGPPSQSAETAARARGIGHAAFLEPPSRRGEPGSVAHVFVTATIERSYDRPVPGSDALRPTKAVSFQAPWSKHRVFQRPFVEKRPVAGR